MKKNTQPSDGAKKRYKNPKKARVQPEKDERPEDDGRTDWGGIPNRDFKKNLGCG